MFVVQSFSSSDLPAKESLYIFKPGFQTRLLNPYFDTVPGVLEGATNPHDFNYLLLHLKLDKTLSAQESIQTFSGSF